MTEQRPATGMRSQLHQRIAALTAERDGWKAKAEEIAEGTPHHITEGVQ